MKTPLQNDLKTEIERMGPLATASYAIIDYVQARTPDSSFTKYTEWLLEPDTWIALKFNHARRYDLSVTVSIGVPFHALQSHSLLPLRRGRRENWSRFNFAKVIQIPAVFSYLEAAYLGSKNNYRKQHGTPQNAL